MVIHIPKGPRRKTYAREDVIVEGDVPAHGFSMPPEPARQATSTLDTTREIRMKVFDDHLYELKMRGPRRRIQDRLADHEFLLSAVELGDDYEFSKDICAFLDEADKMCRETWESDRNTINEEFIQRVMLPHVMTTLGECEASIRRNLSDSTIFSVSPHPLSPDALECFERKLSALKNAISERYEIEERELAKQESRNISAPSSIRVAPSAPDVHRRVPASERESFVQPILRTKGLSIHDWAVEAKVDFHTAHDYLRGKTSPRPSTRLKLAKPLGVKVDELPQ